MGQSGRATAAQVLDLVITNALIIDHWGIVKGDIGIKNGRIVKVGKAGNPDTMAGVDPALVVGAATEVIAGEGEIRYAGEYGTRRIHHGASVIAQTARASSAAGPAARRAAHAAR